MLPDTQLALYKNAMHVRELHVIHKKLYKTLFPSRQHTGKIVLSKVEPASSEGTCTVGPFTNLRILELQYLRPLRQYEFDEGIFEIVRQNPGLRRLRIGIEMEPTALFSLVTEHAPNLQELDIDIHWRGDVKALLDNLPQRLRT
ncbi:hypothetical protein BGZ95_006216, partial [Linnemannia exigua]